MCILKICITYGYVSHTCSYQSFLLLICLLFLPTTPNTFQIPMLHHCLFFSLLYYFYGTQFSFIPTRHGSFTFKSTCISYHNSCQAVLIFLLYTLKINRNLCFNIFKTPNTKVNNFIIIWMHILYICFGLNLCGICGTILFELIRFQLSIFHT